MRRNCLQRELQVGVSLTKRFLQNVTNQLGIPLKTCECVIFEGLVFFYYGTMVPYGEIIH